MPAPRPTGKIQELVYEMKVDAVMKRQLITLTPDTPMSRLRSILRDNRISGSRGGGESLVGVISVETSSTGWPRAPRTARWGSGCPAAEDAVRQRAAGPRHQQAGAYGYGGCPWWTPTPGAWWSGDQGDIIEGLLQELQVDSQEESCTATGRATSSRT